MVGAIGFIIYMRGGMGAVLMPAITVLAAKVPVFTQYFFVGWDIMGRCSLSIIMLSIT